MRWSKAGDKLPTTPIHNWLIEEKIEQRKQMNRRKLRANIINSTTKFKWIEKLLQTPIDDYRNLVVWHILVPYLINIRQLSDEKANEAIYRWLDKCQALRRLDFNPNYVIKYNINTAKKAGYLPTSLEKLRIQNAYLYKIITLSQ